MSRTNFNVKIYFIIPALLVIAVAGISPFFEALSTSFFHDIYGIRSFAGLDNFRYLGDDAGFSYSLNITAVWAVSSTLLSLLFSFIIAVALSGRKKMTGLLYAALLIPWGIPVYIAVPLWRALIHGNGGSSILTSLFGIQVNLMLDPAAGFISCLIVNLWMTVPLTAFVLLGALKKIPSSTVEAAILDGADKGVIAAQIYLPQIKGTLTVMGVLNFIKAFKEFTLMFLMTAGGPPLLSGITNRYVIGATTTIDTFLYDVFSNTDDYGISSAYSVMMAAIVILLMLIWRVAGNRKYSLEKKRRLLIFITAALQIIFSWTAGLIPAAVYLAGLKSRRIFKLSIAINAGLIIFNIVTQGFLAGLSPGILPALFTLYYCREKKEYISTGGLNAGFIERLNSSFSTFTVAVLVLSSAAIVYLLFWMSFSGVSACFIDAPLPPYAGLQSYRAIFTEENILIYFRNTILVAGLTGILVPLVCFPAAAWLNSKGRVATAAALTFIQILSITGGMHSLIPLYSSFERIGMVNSYTPLIIISIYHSIPFSMFTITAWLEQMPASFRDIALVEGLSPLGWLGRIVLPLSRPVLTTAVMTAVLGAWNSFMAPLLFLNDDSLYTISVKLYSFVGSIASGAPEWNIFAAASVVNCAIIAAVFSRFIKPAGHTRLSDFTE
ncbi:MAG: ABC transporter permease subunit [Spirochaetales bacterium]|uniref:ABC transporter permease subunit n=1 Tax=Candidatus Thalassospirochaeta sargassi TaxID=3119039 RepID=A0AAJ1IF17_9SPIO|nr:ABC transporter permease subunit [Spirochaetales bacterium]